MEYKKCEHCGEQIHIRSKKCPFCNEIVAEIPEQVEEEIVESKNNIEETEANQVETSETEAKEKTSEEFLDEFKKNSELKENVNFAVGNSEPKDYVYKAEVRHSIEYVEPMSNWFKVFISALCTFPIFGQLIGSFLGVYYVTNEDNDRKSFGKALIVLSIVMFLTYVSYVSQVMSIMGNMDMEALYNSLLK